VQPFADRHRSSTAASRSDLEEIIDLVSGSRARRAAPSASIETKHPTYHESIACLEGRSRASCARRLDRRDSPVFLQSFEPSSLKSCGS